MCKKCANVQRNVQMCKECARDVQKMCREMCRNCANVLGMCKCARNMPGVCNDVKYN